MLQEVGIIYELFLWIITGFGMLLLSLLGYKSEIKKIKRNELGFISIKSPKLRRRFLYFCTICGIGIFIICVYLMVENINDYAKKDYVYEERRLTEITTQLLNINRTLNFDGKYYRISKFYNKNFEIKPGKKYGYYYGKRTEMIVGIEELK